MTYSSYFYASRAIVKRFFDNEGPEQSAHLRSLIRVQSVHPRTLIRVFTVCIRRVLLLFEPCRLASMAQSDERPMVIRTQEGLSEILFAT